MKLITILLTIIILTSCSVKNDEEQGTALTSGTDDQKPVSNNNQDSDDSEPDDDILIDSDGDFVTDLQEKELGRNPNIADMPIIRTRFLQHYRITVSYKSLSDGKKGSFVIDTKKISDDPSFKYRVGEIFFRNNSLKSAALIGRFNGHSHGEYEEHDFSWVTYPEIDSRFFLDQTMKYRQYFDINKYNIENISLEFESSLRLKANSSFNELKNPLLTFRFYNYETESYDVIHSEVVERSVLSGVNEILTTKIENVDPKLVRENFFQKGEFIISELTDYELPSLGTTFTNLKASVKEKTIPVVYNTPLETSLKYVAVGEGKSFSEVMKYLFDDNFVVENERITSIYQFRNSIPNYQRLSELRNMDKKGDWFIFTNPTNKHFLDHLYTKDDVISLSYFLGSELSHQVEEKVFSYRENVSSSNSSKTYPLGNITSNSEISIILSPKNIKGDELMVDGGEVRNQGCNGRRNCVHFPMVCHVKMHGFRLFSKKLVFSEALTDELSRVFIVINQDEYQLSDLLSKKLASTSFKDGNIIISIKDISKIKEVSHTDENVIFIRAKGKSSTIFEGVRLERAEGRGWFMCANIIGSIAFENKLPVNIDSHRFNVWAHNLRWDVLKKSQNKTIYESFSFGVSSVISNKFN